MTDNQNNNFWLFLELLAKRKKFILSFVIILTAISAVIAFLLPQWYRASAIVLPPEEKSKSIINISEGITGLDLVSMATTNEVFVKILESRSISYPIIDRFKLQERYKTDTYTETLEALLSHTIILNTEEGLLLIEVEDKDPQTAADLTNAYIDGLDSLSRKVIADRAKEKKKFFENRLKAVNEDLNIARKDFEKFQLDNKAINFDEQFRLAIEQAIEIKVAISKIDIDLALNQATGTSPNDIATLKKQKQMLNKQLEELESGGETSSFFSLPLSKIPSLKNEYNKYYTRVRVGEEMSALILQQLEQAKIQAEGSYREISVLQRAVPPELKSRPKRRLIVTVVFVLSLIISIVLAALMEYFEQLKFKSEADYNRAIMFLQGYFGWLPGIKKK